MKDFLKHTLATVTGIVIVTILMGIIGIVSLAGIIASGQGTVPVKENSVFVLSLSGVLNERVDENAIGMLMGKTNSGLGLDDILTAINRAKDNDDIKGIYIEAGAFISDSPASSQAIRKQLADFKKSGKWIVAYGEQYTQTTYYICSVADKVFINPQGMIDWHGLAAQPVFLKDLLAKVGVKMQLVKVGKYKSAPETFTADTMSEPNREQVTAYIHGIWDVMLDDVARSRKVRKGQLDEYADSYVALADQKDYVSMKLVDGLMYNDEVKGEIKKILKIDAEDKINQLSLSDMLGIKTKKDDGDEIAVYYAYGDIVESDAGGPARSHRIASETVCRDLEKLAADDNVKAVVLRVNSGGGSAYASEQIWHSMMNLKKKKPVVVSMGGMAASGGYYISCPANYIYAESTTLTGSIGIFGMFPDFSGMLTDKLGLKYDEVKTNSHSSFGNVFRPYNADELAMLDTYIDRGYKLFRKRVADGRRMKTEAVEEIAQGRVWLGRDALKHKLVDAIGGMNEAVAKAAELAKLKEHHTASYPAPPSWMDQLMGCISTESYLDEQMKAALGEYYGMFAVVRDVNRLDAVQARIPYDIVIR